ncbi:MAG: colicin immunity domain-containing protein [Nocardioides sp.]
MLSHSLLAYAHELVDGTVMPGAFADRYIARWKEERDSGVALVDEDPLSEILSTIFCLADLYSAEPDRAAYEYDDEQLIAAVAAVLRQCPAGPRVGTIEEMTPSD